MPRNGSGTYTAPANSANPAVPFSSISSADHNAVLNDLVAALTDSLSRSGSGGMSANLAMGSHKVTGVSDGSVATDAATVGQVAAGYQPLNANLTTISSSGVTSALINNDAVTFAKFQNIATARLLGRTTASSGDVEEISVGAGLTLSGGSLSSSAVAATGSVINSTSAAYTANANIATTIPADDTPPLDTEGTQIISLSITPSATANKIRLRFSAFGTSDQSPGNIVTAIFRGSTCINASNVSVASASYGATLALDVEDSPATTSAVTYSVRIGRSAGNVRLNGSAAGRYFGGAAAATLIAEEIKG